MVTGFGLGCVWPNPLDPGLFQDRVDATMPEKLPWTTLDRKHWSYDWAKVSGGLGWNLFQPKGSFLRKLEGDQRKPNKV